MKEIKQLVEIGAISPIITRTFSLIDIPEIHKMAEQGILHGKISIVVNEALAALSGK